MKDEESTKLSESKPPARPGTARFQRASESALNETALERAQDDGWNIGNTHLTPTHRKAVANIAQDLVASVWRVLPDAFVFPREDEYQVTAARNGWELTRSVEPEDGGFRHELVVQFEAHGQGKRLSQPANNPTRSKPHRSHL